MESHTHQVTLNGVKAGAVAKYHNAGCLIRDILQNLSSEVFDFEYSEKVFHYWHQQ